ncbi:MAG: SDR family NAD(P)-dependent oxidoreductase [Brachymonas sp.]|jgi:nucleoside-diphosphate-sugar epimerase
MTRSILITGGQGFVGRALVERFNALGFRTICADLNDKPLGGAAFEGVAFIKLDVRDKAAVIAACQGVDSIIHNASLVHTKHNRVEDVWAVNLDGAKNILAACEAHQIPRLVYVSSASVVYEGKDIRGGDESLPYTTVSQAPYADSKLAAEKLSLAFDRKTSGKGHTTVCAVRPHVIFGAGDGRLIPAIIDKVKKGQLSRQVGSREKQWDFTYIDNLVDAIVTCEDKLTPDSPAGGQAYFVTNGEPMPFFEFAERMIAHWGYPPITGKVPYWLAYAVASVAEFWDTLKGGTLNAENGLTRFSIQYMATDHYYNISKIQRDLGWQPKISLLEGIKRTAEGVRAAGKV